MRNQTCRVTESKLLQGHSFITLENDLISVGVLPEKGADIYSFIYKPLALDVLWKSPWGLRPRQTPQQSGDASSEANWLDQYEGGWQFLFPSAGDACRYHDAPMPFHGEASLSCWTHRIVEDGPGCRVELTVRLCRSPFRIQRNLEVRADTPVLHLEELITNESNQDMHYMWTHHPAFGAPFVSGDCRLEVPGRRFLSHPGNGPTSRLEPGSVGPWPLMTDKHGGEVDLSRAPSEGEPVAEFGYISELEKGLYTLRNERLAVAFTLTWPQEVFPYVWFWQEMQGSTGYPWYGSCYVMAVEPATSYPGTGLVNAIEQGTAPILKAGQTQRVEISAALWSLPRK